MWLRVVDCYYTTEDTGYAQTMPLVHLLGRDREWRRHHIPVEGFRPYFLVRESEWAEKYDLLTDDERLLDVTTTDRQGRSETALDGEGLVRLTCREPANVGDLREIFEDPFEADVQFPSRFLIDHAEDQWIQVPDELAYREYDPEGYGTPDPVALDTLTGTETDETPPEQVPPLRVCTYDIEVRQSGEGPPVVSQEGCEQTRNPITSICAHDSYSDEYRLWCLAHDSWGIEEANAATNATRWPVEVYENPVDVVSQFCAWVVNRRMDALTAWNGAGFDHPYLVNYARQNGVSAVYDFSPTGDVYPIDGDGSFINSSVKGRLLLDAMVMYEKTQIHELDSKRLADVAEAEDVSMGKLDIDDAVDPPADVPAIDFAWANDPETFVEYSHRDVAATVAINRECNKNVSIV